VANSAYAKHWAGLNQSPHPFEARCLTKLVALGTCGFDDPIGDSENYPALWCAGALANIDTDLAGTATSQPVTIGSLSASGKSIGDDF
jgi:hypothetical protein